MSSSRVWFPSHGCCPLSLHEHHPLPPPPHTHTYTLVCARCQTIWSCKHLSYSLSLPPSPVSSSSPCFILSSLISPWPTQTLSHTPLSPAGEITTTSLLDRETKSEYILIVRAVDGGVGHNQKTGIATVSAHPSLACSPAPHLLSRLLCLGSS